MKLQGLKIGILKEIMEGERRVSATPETVAKMTKEGAIVFVQRGAGDGSFFHDEEYRKQGAEIIDDASEIYSMADVVLKVKEPQFNKEKGCHEVQMMKKGQNLITFLHPASPSNHEMVRELAKKEVTSFTLDGIPRISRAQSMDALTSMSTVAGYKSVLMAADRLAKFMPMIGTAIGMIKPAEVLVIGAGVAGLQAIATARRLGAVVHAVDIRPDASEQAKSLGAKLIDVGIPAEAAVGEGGYAKHLPSDLLLKEQEVLKDIVPKVDIIILSALVPGKIAPILITEEMVQSMKAGSVIMDISIDQGGNCQITDAGKVSEKHGIIIDGTKNIPGKLPTSSTWMFANNILNYLLNMVENGKVAVRMEDEIIASSLVTYNGKIVHSGALEAMK